MSWISNKWLRYRLTEIETHTKMVSHELNRCFPRRLISTVADARQRLIHVKNTFWMQKNDVSTWMKSFIFLIFLKSYRIIRLLHRWRKSWKFIKWIQVLSGRILEVFFKQLVYVFVLRTVEKIHFCYLQVLFNQNWHNIEQTLLIS